MKSITYSEKQLSQLGVWDKMMRGLSTRNYGVVVKEFHNVYGIEKSAVSYAEAIRALDRLPRELMDLNPSAARSLEEGMDETLTVHKLRVPDQLRGTLCCTNVIESAFSIVEPSAQMSNAGGQAIRSSAGLVGVCWSPSGSSAKSSAIARFRYCYLRWPTLFLRNPLRGAAVA